MCINDEIARASTQKSLVYRVALAQLIILLPWCFTLLFVDIVAAYSALLGGVNCLVPSLYFTSCAFRFSGARVTPLIVRAFYGGETGKFVLTALGFSLIFLLLKPVDVLALFFTYGLMIAVQQFTLASIFKVARVEGKDRCV